MCCSIILTRTWHFYIWEKNQKYDRKAFLRFKRVHKFPFTQRISRFPNLLIFHIARHGFLALTTLRKKKRWKKNQTKPSQIIMTSWAILSAILCNGGWSEIYSTRDLLQKKKKNRKRMPLKKMYRPWLSVIWFSSQWFWPFAYFIENI